MLYILNGLLVGLRAGMVVTGTRAGIVLGLLAVCAVIAVFCQIIALFVGEPRRKNAEDTKDGE